MLGDLVEKHEVKVLQDAGEEVPEEENSETPWVSFAFHISCDTEFLEAMRRDLKLMTDERNQLVHGFPRRWHPSSPNRSGEAR